MGYGLIVTCKYGDLPDMFITLCNPSGNLGSWNWIYIENHSNVLSIVSIQIYYIYLEKSIQNYLIPQQSNIPPYSQNQPHIKDMNHVHL